MCYVWLVISYLRRLGKCIIIFVYETTSKIAKIKCSSSELKFFCVNIYDINTYDKAVIMSFRKEIMFWVCYLPTLWQVVIKYPVFLEGFHYSFCTSDIMFSCIFKNLSQSFLFQIEETEEIVRGVEGVEEELASELISARRRTILCTSFVLANKPPTSKEKLCLWMTDKMQLQQTIV